MKKIILLLTFTTSLNLTYSQTTIQDAHAQGVGATVTISGIVTNGAEMGTIRYIQDNTAGIALYSSSLDNTDRGDSLTVSGTLKDYNGLLEMDPVSSYTLLSSGNTLPSAVILSPDQLGEAYESQLVEVKNVSFTNGGGTFSSNTDYTFTDGTNTGIIYLKTGNALVGTIIPTGGVDIVGILSEYSGKYEILPRDANDIVNTSAIYYTSAESMSNLSTSGFEISWATNKASNAFAQYGYTKNLELGIVSGTTNSTSQSVSITGANPSEVLYVQTFSTDGTDTAASNTKTYITQSLSSGEIKVYFTRSVDNTYSSGTNAQALENTVDDTLIAYIGRAKESIDVAIYNMNGSSSNLSDMSSALNTAYSNGINIRVVYDASTTNSGIDDLNSSIPKLISSNVDGIMHNKFMIIDAHATDANKPIVWTGSTNWTEDNINTDANNVIIIQDKSLALNYELEFEEMWGDTGSTPNASAAHFGALKEDNTAHSFIIGGVEVESYFSPSDNTNAVILDAIESSNDQLFISTMLITRSDIAYSIDDRVDAGVETYCMLNSEGESSTLVLDILESDIGDHLVFYDQEEGTLHHKYMIADPNNSSSDPLVLTGCHNWSNSANDENDENTLVVHDAAISNLYLQEFMSRYNLNWLSGIEEMNNYFTGITAYPNPADDVLYLSFNLNTDKDVKIEFTNILGEVIKSENYSALEGINIFPLNTHEISEGLYQMIVSSGESRKSLKVVVK
jgi:phosphatidylserine/phosphatidylglycerophosphate/cardiolipin synthase-like enzyme/DNA/RNA endonuclease YhcR with UshA esterase domain